MKKTIPIVFVLGLFVLQTSVFGVGTDRRYAPVLNEVLPVKSNLIALYIQEGFVESARMVPYIKQDGDRIEVSRSKGEIKEEHGIVVCRTVYRDGEVLGFLGGEAGEETIELRDYYHGDVLDLATADAVDSYLLTDESGHTFLPAKVYRKSKPYQFGRYQGKLGMLHTVYLELPEHMTEGDSFNLSFPPLNLQTSSVDYNYLPRLQRSEAVHVNQVGFAPHDPVKRAFVSLWTGKAGKVDFGESLNYHIVDAVRGKTVFSGEAELFWPANQPEKLYREANYTNADVYRLDFPEVSREGRYYVYVEGVGCSYPFDVRENVWEELATVCIKGIYQHRSGVELKEPYTDFWRPRPHHPADGIQVYQSGATLLETTMGMMGGTRNTFEALIEEATDEVLPHAWGGMMDAGDWDRRIQHLQVTRMLLELYELQPEYCAKLDLNIPESDNDIPDVVDEALWILDFFVRMQQENGAVSGGVEAAAHPIRGDVSWNESIPVYAYAPDYWSTHQLVASAAKAAYLLKNSHPDLAAKYQVSALKGIEWAEEEFKKESAAGKSHTKSDAALAFRNLAAIELYRLTGDQKWHDLFEENTVLSDSGEAMAPVAQRDALWTYLNLPDGLGKESWKKLARKAILADADFGIEYSNNNAFSHLATKQGHHPFIGFLSGPQEGYHLLRAYHLTGDDRYLKPVYASTQFGLGANPDNNVYITGMGSHPVEWVLHEDSFKTGRPVPKGIMICGPFDHLADYNEYWSYFSMWVDMLGVNDRMDPEFTEWPVHESYCDIWNFGSQNEYTPWQTMSKPSLIWGYLAALAEHQ